MGRSPSGEKNCAVCGAPFLWISWNQKVCSPRCRFQLDVGSGADDECWNWRGRLIGGYGFFTLRGERFLAHRLSYELNKGPIPTGLLVLHSCDNPRCTNPAHLWVGTYADNNADRSAKGRSGSRVYNEADRQKYSLRFRGSKQWNAKLTEEQARAIKYRHPELSNRAVARLYGVSRPTAGNIRTGRAWKHL